MMVKRRLSKRQRKELKKKQKTKTPNSHQHSGKWLYNILANIINEHYEIKSVFHSDLDQYKNRKWVLIGAAPSLDQSKEQLSGLRDQGYVIGCMDRALVCLADTIRPDLAFTIDPDFFHEFDRWTGDTPTDFPLIASLKTGFRLTRNWRGPKYWYMHENRWNPEIFTPIGRALGVPFIKEYAHVTAVAYTLALLWDAREVRFLGNDYAFLASYHYRLEEGGIVCTRKMYANPIETVPTLYFANRNKATVVTDSDGRQYPKNSWPYPEDGGNYDLDRIRVYTSDHFKYLKHQLSLVPDYVKKIKSGKERLYPDM